MAKYGYTGAKPNQDQFTGNSGVFGVNDMVELRNKNKFKRQTVTVQYLVIAGGGGGGGQLGGGGGAGGYRNSYAGETSGANSSTETPSTIILDEPITVTIGAGGSAGSGLGTLGSSGSQTKFYDVTCRGGGRGARHDYPGQPQNGGSGGGGSANATAASGTTNEGMNGGNGLYGPGVCPNHYLFGGGGGGASQAGDAASCGGGDMPGGNGLYSSITGTSVGRAGGGSGGGNDTTANQTNGVTVYGGGRAKAGNGSNPSYSGVNGKGGGGAGAERYGTAGNGGSGVVILRYPNTYTVTTSGLTTGGEQTDGLDNYIEITAGIEGTITWSEV